jgi:hypothetical protein
MGLVQCDQIELVFFETIPPYPIVIDESTGGLKDILIQSIEFLDISLPGAERGFRRDN